MGSPIDSVVSFIDGTGIEIERPRGTSQRATYSVHKRHNCLKFQAISAPDGLVLHIFGPVEGRWHDMFLCKESGIDDGLRSSLVISNWQYYVYGYPAYILRQYLQVGFTGSPITPEELAFNASMSKLRVIVAWAFRGRRGAVASAPAVARRFATESFRECQRRRASPVGLSTIYHHEFAKRIWYRSARGSATSPTRYRSQVPSWLRARPAHPRHQVSHQFRYPALHDPLLTHSCKLFRKRQIVWRELRLQPELSYAHHSPEAFSDACLDKA
jgi:DDE superfamily endonuclease